MLTSYNGWTASPTPDEFGGITPLVIDGESFAPGVRSGDVHALFTAFWTDFARTVEPLYQVGWHAADDWGYAFRQNRNANNITCHGSGTATDGNATRHPNGVPASRTFSQPQIDQIRYLCKVKYRGLIRWGGDFTGVPDSMHVEIIGTPGQIHEFVVTVLQGQPSPGTGNLPLPRPMSQPWLMLPAVRSHPASFQRWYNAEPFRPALLPIIAPIANNFGPQSEAALKKVQARYGLVADGIDGPLTKKVLWDLGWRG
jgi:peptidoglycan hydrolase-like protein with peptidoglycan-binding domain